MNLRAQCVINVILVLSSLDHLVAQDRQPLLAKINATRTFLLKQRVAADYRESIHRSVLAYENNLSGHCKDVELDFDSVDVRDRILAVLELDDKGMPVAGTWRESLPGKACNEKKNYNVQIDVTRKGLRFTPTFPGDAAGNPELQRDTLRNIETNFQMLQIPTNKSCHLEVVNTHLVGPSSMVLENGITWRNALCKGPRTHEAVLR